jgi:hypothetical protein
MSVSHLKAGVQISETMRVSNITQTINIVENKHYSGMSRIKYTDCYLSSLLVSEYGNLCGETSVTYLQLYWIPDWRPWLLLLSWVPCHD